MFITWICCCLLLVEGRTELRLFNSQVSQDGQYPYVVFHIARSGSRRFRSCSGSILSEVWVLTAAHCLQSVPDPTRHLVVAGGTNLTQYIESRYRGRIPFSQNLGDAFGVQERRVLSIHVPPDRTGRSVSNDVGLLRLRDPLLYDRTVSGIALGREPFERRKDCVVLGFGRTEDGQRGYTLRYIHPMEARPSSECVRRRYPDSICLADRTRGICAGDSGGPLVCGGQVRGVASLGVSRGSTRGCGVGVLEQFFADVEKNLSWLDLVLGGNSTRRKKRKRNKKKRPWWG